MNRRPRRPRRQIPSSAVPAIRLAGWRYSATREAWVHRLGEGRVGPVFCVDGRSQTFTATEDTALFDAVMASRRPIVAPPAERAPLPRRRGDDRHTVEVSLAEGEAPRTVVVDGRPPRRGTDPRSLQRPGAPVRARDGHRASA